MTTVMQRTVGRTSSDQEVLWLPKWTGEGFVERTPSDQETSWILSGGAEIDVDARLSLLCDLSQSLYPELSTTIICRGGPSARQGVSITHDNAARVPARDSLTVTVTGTHIVLDELFRPHISRQRFLVLDQSRFAPDTEQEMEQETPVPRANPHRDAIQWIRDSTGLSVESIADLVNVSRPALYGWMKGRPITDEHRRHLLAIVHILQRAAELYTTKEQLATWLYAPRGADGRTAADLLKARDFDRARLLAITAASPGVRRPPEWVSESGPGGVPAWKERLVESSQLGYADESLEAHVDQPAARMRKSRITRRR